VPVFQEQAMKVALDAAKFTPAEANQLRKAMATFRSRGTIELLQDKMVGRMIERGYDPDFAQRCFDQIKGFGEYGFPESHAASFAHLVYVSSWIRWKYPAAFAAALLNSQPMAFTPLRRSSAMPGSMGSRCGRWMSVIRIGIARWSMARCGSASG
jgi:error-prone DNA polymerase